MTLTKRQREVLQGMIDAEESDDEEQHVYAELTWSKGGGWWWGNERTSGAFARELLMLMLVSQLSGSTRETEMMQTFVVNESGRRALSGEKPYRDRNGNYHESLKDLFAAHNTK